MRNALVPLLMLTACLVLNGCVPPRISVVNASRIYQESDAGKAGIAHLEQVEKEVKGKAEAAQRLAEAMPDNSAMPMSLQQFFVACQEAMNNAQQEAVNSVQELINQSIALYRERNKVAIIMQSDAVLSSDPTVDVTDAVIAEMNKSSISFAPVNIADFVPPQAPPKPAPTKPAQTKAPGKPR